MSREQAQVTTSSGIPWARLTAEACAIVLSILLAFTIDAWWDGVNASREERDLLMGLNGDFELMKVEAVRVQTASARIQEASQRLLTMTGPEPVEPDRSLVDSLLASLINTEVFVASEGTLAALLTSQGLGSIASLELRARLAEWPGHIAILRRAEATQQELIDDHLFPYLRRRVPIRSLDVISSPGLGTRRSRFPLTTSRLLTELEFENLINDVYFTTNQAESALTALESASSVILGLLDEQLIR